MEGRNRFLEQAKLIDLQIASPDERATVIWKSLKPVFEQQKWTDWDMICFCSQYLAGISMQIPALMEPLKDLNRLIYTIHYYDRESDDRKGSGIGSVDKDSGSITSRQQISDDLRLDVEGNEIK